MRLRAEERAAKVFGVVNDYRKGSARWDEVEAAVAALIREAHKEGRSEMREEAIEWCMAFRRDDGTAQAIETKIRENI